MTVFKHYGATCNNITTLEGVYIENTLNNTMNYILCCDNRSRKVLPKDDALIW